MSVQKDIQGDCEYKKTLYTVSKVSRFRFVFNSWRGIKELSNEVRLTANQLTPVVRSVWADRASVSAEMRAYEQKERAYEQSRDPCYSSLQQLGTPHVAIVNQMIHLPVWYLLNTYGPGHVTGSRSGPVSQKPTYIWQSEHRCTYDIRQPIPQAFVYLASSTHT